MRDSNGPLSSSLSYERTKRRVVARLNKLKTVYKPIEIQATAPNISSDSGLLILRKLDERHGLSKRFASCIVDPRRGEVEHTLEKMVAQRLYGIAQGWEDCNDFDTLRQDPLYSLTLGSLPASQPTLSRFENWVDYKALRRMSDELVDVFVARHQDRPPKRIVIDIDATEDPTHGQQEFQFFNKFYDCHCYLPLMVFGMCDDLPMEILAAILRPGNAHSGRRAGAILWRLAKRLKEAFPLTKILVRADGGFSSPEFYTVCESLGLDYLVCIPTNPVLARNAEPLMVQARAEQVKIEGAARVYGEFSYSAGSWNKKERRIIVKAEALPGKDNARYVVTNLSHDPKVLYEIYCLRGECENRIKEMKLDLASGRTSCCSFTANAFRLMLHALAFALLSIVRDHLAQTELAKCTIGKIRLKLLKMAAIVEQSTRRTLVRLPRGHPHVKFLMDTLAS
jgi:Transposase DDE domain group 1